MYKPCLCVWWNIGTVKYWQIRQAVVNSPNQNLLFKYHECSAEVICQFTM